jgi:hypothetical protein
MGFDDDGQAVPVYSPSLPLEVECLQTLRGLDLDKDHDAAIRIIQRVIDDAEFRGLANGIGHVMRQIDDKADAVLFQWLLSGKAETLRELGERLKMSAPGVLKRTRKLQEKLRGILHGKLTAFSS